MLLIHCRDLRVWIHNFVDVFDKWVDIPVIVVAYGGLLHLSPGFVSQIIGNPEAHQCVCYELLDVHIYTVIPIDDRHYLPLENRMSFGPNEADAKAKQRYVAEFALRAFRWPVSVDLACHVTVNLFLV